MAWYLVIVRHAKLGHPHQTQDLFTVAILIVKGVMEGLTAEVREQLADLIARFQANGGKIRIYPVCMKIKGLVKSDSIPGIEVASARRSL